MTFTNYRDTSKEHSLSSGILLRRKVMNISTVACIFYLVIVGTAFLLYPAVIIVDEIIQPPQRNEIAIIGCSVKDGPNMNNTTGCFFTIRAEAAVDIDPMRYTFWVAEEGFSPKQMDFQFRDYSPNGTPIGGDRNATYRYDAAIKSGRWPDMPVEEDRERWNDGEFIGFDMPTDDMGIHIVSGNNYEVLIKNPNNDIIYRDTFKYKSPL